MDNIKIVLEDIEENSYIISLLGRFATVERIEDKTVNGWDYVYSFPQYEITNIKNIVFNNSRLKNLFIRISPIRLVCKNKIIPAYVRKITIGIKNPKSIIAKYKSTTSIVPI